MNTNVWAGDWRKRTCDRILRLGYSSPRDFAAAHLSLTYSALSELLGEGAPIQLMWIIGEQYAEDGDVNGFVAESLVRHLLEHVRADLVRGSQQRLEYQIASAFSAWETLLGDRNGGAVESVWQELRPKLMNGWMPKTILDSAVRQVIVGQRWVLPEPRLRSIPGLDA